MNKNYLSHDYVTDIMTFPYSEKKPQIEGELFISLDRVKENSKTFATGYLNEIKRVIIHGCLHLAGYKDKSRNQTAKMRKKEDYYLSF